MKLRVNNSEIELVQGDITESDTDAIVNAANSQLVLGAGVAGAIRTKGGPAIQEECNAIGHCPVGGAVITSGGNLKARHVIHAVGPRQGEGNEEEKLKNATLSSLKVAEENNLKSITFPAISTGVYGFPLDACARIMLTTVKEYLSGPTKIERVVFALFDDQSFKAFKDQLKKLK
ncbi:MAG: macro domain-containing protein [Nitrospinae bacterium]|nr:macro domain-containing protein [Nitrospinota bacterium]